MRSRLCIAIGVVSTLVFSCCRASADVKLTGIFSDHMIIQRDAKVPIWGTAAIGEAVTVKVANRKASTTADAKGKWRVVLDPISSSDPIEITVAGHNSITIKDVLVGEVWLCSGQSNMGFKLKGATGAKEAIAAAKLPKMRFYTMDRATPETPREETSGHWEVCSPENAGDFSAVAFYFGRTLQEKLDVPVGLIDSSWGGTRAEAWLPRAEFDSLKLPYEPAWTEQWLHPKQNPNAKKPEPARPHEAPSVLFNGMIAPIAGFAMRGAVWYQGETNTAYPKEYRQVLGAMIQSWRKAWQQGDFPFLVVQLPNFEGAGRDWAALRASQAGVASDLPNVGLAVTIDVGNPKNIHPTDKLVVGQRLALVAEHLAYGRDVEYSGPAFKSAKTSGESVVVSFDHIAGGLVAKNDALLGFELAGDDGQFASAKARIDGEQIMLTADGVKSPKMIRYGWANNPTCTLYNKAGLPAMPFEAKAE